MKSAILRNCGRVTCWLSTFYLALAVGVPQALATETDAKTLFKAMSDYLAAQKSISFDYDTTLELVTPEQQKIAIAASGSVELARPDKIRATRMGGFANVEMSFDGKTLTILGKDANVFGQEEVPGTIDHLVDVLREQFHRPLPGADLLMSNVEGELMPLVTDVKDLGSGVIRGKECDHLAFRTKEVDWQIWIAQGNEPYPCRYVVTSPSVAGFPQYSIDVSGWKASTAESAVNFSFTPPAGATKVNRDQLTGMGDLPDIYQPK
jgi:hypothetical protein